MKDLGLFKALCLGFLLLLAGCTGLKENSHVTTCEALDMELDSTTISEAECILKSYGYSVKTNVPKISKKNRRIKFPELSLNFLDSVADKLRTLEVQVPKNNERMKFFFDNNQKLIGFSAHGDRKILDSLIANDNKNREVLVSLSPNSLTQANRQKVGDLISKYVKSQAIKKRKSKKFSRRKWDTTTYVGNDLSIATNIHTDEYRDFSFYSVTSPGAIRHMILGIRDNVKTLSKKGTSKKK